MTPQSCASRALVFLVLMPGSGMCSECVCSLFLRLRRACNMCTCHSCTGGGISHNMEQSNIVQPSCECGAAARATTHAPRRFVEQQVVQNNPVSLQGAPSVTARSCCRRGRPNIEPLRHGAHWPLRGGGGHATCRRLPAAAAICRGGVCMRHGDHGAAGAAAGQQGAAQKGTPTAHDRRRPRVIAVPRPASAAALVRAPVILREPHTRAQVAPLRGR